MRQMKAAVLDESGALHIREVPIPAIPAYGALVRIRYGTTCAGTDMRLMRKEHPNPISYPAILGHESVGRVVALGPNVRNFKPGDLISRVGAPAMPEAGLGICWGGFAQFGIALDWRAMEADGVPRVQWEKARVNQVIPESIDERCAPMIITWRETLSYTNRVGVKRGDRVLIAGSGANALAFLRHCVCAGAEVVALGSAQRSADALRLGAKCAVDYHSAVLREELAAAAPGGFDVIIDAVGVAADVNAALPLLCEGGVVAVYGWNDRKGYGINPFCAKNSFRVYCGGYDEPETHEEVLRRVLDGRLDARDWFDPDHPIPLEHLADAYDRLRRREAYKFLIDLQ